MTDDPERQKKLIEELSLIVNELGWVIGLPAGVDVVPGLIVGTEEFVKDVVGTYYGPNYDVFKEDPTGENNLIEEPRNESEEKKKTTYH